MPSPPSHQEIDGQGGGNRDDRIQQIVKMQFAKHKDRKKWRGHIHGEVERGHKEDELREVTLLDPAEEHVKVKIVFFFVLEVGLIDLGQKAPGDQPKDA